MTKESNKRWGPKSYPLDSFITKDVNHTILSPNAVVLNLASYWNPGDSLKEMPITRLYPSQESLGGGTQASVFFKLLRWLQCVAKVDHHCSRQVTVISEFLSPSLPRGRGICRHRWLSSLSFTLLKNSIGYQLWVQLWVFPHALMILRAIFDQANTSKERKDGQGKKFP